MSYTALSTCGSCPNCVPSTLLSDECHSDTSSSFRTILEPAPYDDLETEVLGLGLGLEGECGGGGGVHYSNSNSKSERALLHTGGIPLRRPSQCASTSHSCAFVSFTAVLIVALWLLTAPHSSLSTYTPPASTVISSALPTPPPPPPPPPPSQLPSCAAVLPSCAILSSNLTANLLHHSSTIQHDNVHADCTDYYHTGSCVSVSVTGQQRAFRPQWLVFVIESGPDANGAGGLADRLKGLLTVLPLALLVGRAFAVHVIDFLPFSDVYGRSHLEWVEWEGIPEQVRLGAVTHELDWINLDYHPISRGNADWRYEWRNWDIVKIKVNLNSFPDLVENSKLMRAYRAFGFHAATEKGDMDVYWECLLEYALSFQQPVLSVLNPLLAQIGHPGVVTWRDRQEQSDLTAVSPYMRWLLPSASATSESRHTHSNRRLYCAQIRMGAAGHRATGNGSIGFADSESFIASSLFDSILAQLHNLIEQHQHSMPSPAPYTLFITSDSNEYQQALPARWADVPQLEVPGPTAHIDKLKDVADQYDVVLAAYVKSIVTHYLLGECDIAAVSSTGYGTTARWRTRNHALAAGRPFRDRAYNGTYLINVTDAAFTPYRHRRGSGGREDANDYYPISEQLQTLIDRELVTEPAVRAMFNVSLYDTYQASSELPVEPPADSMSKSRRQATPCV